MSIYDETQPTDIASLKTEIEELKKKLETLAFETNSDDARSLRFLFENINSYNPGHRHVPIVVTLTDAASVTLQANKGDEFYLLAAGNRTILAPTDVLGVANNFQNGKKIIIRHEASGADRTLSLTTGSAGAFRFGTSITALTATTSGLVDYIGCIYNSNDARWDCVAVAKGF